MVEIPIIDIAALLEPPSNSSDDAHYQQTIQLIEHALGNIGFMYITNHGITREEEEMWLNLSKEFFNQSLEDKKKIARKEVEGSNGYVAIGVENLDDLQPQATDFKECYDLCVSEVHPMYKANLWPTEETLPGWKDKIKVAMAKLEKLSSVLLKVFASILGESEDFLSKWYSTYSSSLVRILRYPPVPEDNNNTIGCGAHSDYGILTLLLQDSIGGLQILYKDKWIDAPPKEGTLVINVGDCMEYLTNGAFKATKHRVINKSTQKERHVFLMFYEPEMDMPIDCVEKYKDRKETFLWPRTKKYGEHLVRRLGATYSLD